MQYSNLIQIGDVTEYLNSYFNISHYPNKDTSFIERIHHYFDIDTISKFEPGFDRNCNGLMFSGNNPIKNIYGSTFLSDDVLLELLAICNDNNLLIVHHPINIDCGLIKGYDSIGYKAVSKKLLYSFLNRGNSIYVIHLPLDLNKYAINTHYSLLCSLDIKNTISGNFLEMGEYTLGYILKTDPMDVSFLISKIKNVASESFYINNKNQIPETISCIGLLAGMFSSIYQIKHIEECNCDIFVCGDVFIRDGSKRYYEMKRAVEDCLVPIICMSHNISEGQVFRNGLFPYLKKQFPMINYYDIQCDVFR